MLFIRISDGDHEELKQDGDSENPGCDLRQNAAAIDQKQKHSGRQQRGDDQKSRADVRRKKRELKPLVAKIVIHEIYDPETSLRNKAFRSSAHTGPIRKRQTKSKIRFIRPPEVET